MEKFDCIFGFSVKSYVRNTINLSCVKILLTSVISESFSHSYWSVEWFISENKSTCDSGRDLFVRNVPALVWRN